MGANIPLPALDIKTPQQPDMLGQYGKLVALQNAQQQGQMQKQQMQMGGLELQQKQMEVQSQTAIMRAVSEAVGGQKATTPTSTGTGATAQGGLGTQPSPMLGGASGAASQPAGASSPVSATAPTKGAPSPLSGMFPAYDTLPPLSKATIDKAASYGATPDALGKMINSYTEQGTKLATYNADQRKNFIAANDATHQLINNFTALPPDEQAKQFPTFAQNFNQASASSMHQLTLDPARFDPAQTPAALKAIDGGLALSTEQITADTKKTAEARAQKEQEYHIGPMDADKINQLNTANAQGWKQLHPNASFPDALKLSPNSTPADFTRLEGILTRESSNVSTQTQRDIANQMRQQTQVMMQQSQQERQQREGLQPVIGTDPKTGKDVLVSASDAKQLGLTGSMKAGEQEVTKAQAARHWIPLATQEGTTPDTMGILPLINKMDKEGKLGVVASRWNDFLTGKVGAGDPEYTALRTKVGLSTTLLMNAHVGSRGGAYMMEHFENLANSGKMNAETLKSGIQSELNYVQSRAMLPERQAQQNGNQTQSTPGNNSVPSQGKPNPRDTAIGFVPIGG